MNRDRRRLSEAPVRLPTFANREDDVSLKGLAKAEMDRIEAERKQKEQKRAKAKARRRAKGIIDELNNKSSIDDKMEFLFNILVPASGKADTTAGEIVRAIEKIRYRDYNDGDLFYAGYGLESAAAPAAEYIFETGDKAIQECINDIIDGEYSDDRYSEQLNVLASRVIDYLLENPELFYEPNEDDMLDYEPSFGGADLKPHEFDCDFGEFTRKMLDDYNRDAVDIIWDWLNAFAEQHSTDGRVETWARDGYSITQLDIVEIDEMERDWDAFSRDLEEYLIDEYGDGDDDEDDEL